MVHLRQVRFALALGIPSPLVASPAPRARRPAPVHMQRGVLGRVKSVVQLVHQVQINL